MTLSVQFFTIISMIAGGVYLGAAVDTFHRFGYIWKKRLVFSYLIEVFFWLLQTLVLFYFLYLVNQGELRFYVLLAILCGYAMYRGLFETIYKRVLERLISISLSLYHFIYRLVQVIIVLPLKKLIQLIIAIVLGLYAVLIWLLTLLFKVVYYPFKFLIGLIWRLVPQNAKKYFYHLAGFYSKIKNRLIKWWKYIRSKRG